MKFLIFCITFALAQINTNAGGIMEKLDVLKTIWDFYWEEEAQDFLYTGPKLFGIFILSMLLWACVSICRCCCGCCLSSQKNNMKQQSQVSQFSWNKAPIQNITHSKAFINNTTQQLTQLMVLFETRTLKLSFQQWAIWFAMEIENTSITRNFDGLDLKIVGKDTHGKWQLKGLIYINNDQIECSLNKAYDNKKAEDGEQLYYRGIYNEKDQKFKGNWQFEKSGLKGQWEGEFK